MIERPGTVKVRRLRAKSSRLFGRFFTAALGSLFILLMVAAAGHIHHDARESASCALCAISQTPAVETSPTQGSPNLEFNPVNCLAGPERAHESPAPAGNPTRAPPLA